MRLLDLKIKKPNTVNLNVVFGSEFNKFKILKNLNEFKIIVFLVFLGFVLPAGSSNIYTNSFYSDSEKSNLSQVASSVAFEIEILNDANLTPTSVNKKILIKPELEKISDGARFEINPIKTGQCENIDFKYLINNIETGNYYIWDSAFPDLQWQIEMSPIETDVKIDCQISFELYSSFGNDFGLENGFFDKEATEFLVYIYNPAKPIVLNEVVAYPDEDQTPKGEWIELYNNGDVAIDIFGWEISEISGSLEKKYTISNSKTATTFVTLGGSTLVPAGGFAIILIDGSKLNNTGETIKLYNDGGDLVDTFIFKNAIQGQSFSRLPDGTGDWELAKMTPNLPNEPLLEALSLSSFSNSDSENFENNDIPLNNFSEVETEDVEEIVEQGTVITNQEIDLTVIATGSETTEEETFNNNQSSENVNQEITEPEQLPLDESNI